MFTTISKSLKLAASMKPMLNMGTLAAKPLILKNFPNKCDSSSAFIIKQLERPEIEEAAACIAEAFSKRETITQNFQIENKNLFEGVKKDLEKAVEENLCLVCRDKKSNKLAGVIYYEDLDAVLEPKNWQENMEKDEKWGKLEKFYEYLFNILSPYAETKGRNDVLLFKKLAVAENFTRLGVATNLLFAARYLHPRTTKANRRLMIASNEKTYKFCLNHGWQLIKEVNLKDCEHANFASGDKVYLLKYEPKEGKTIIQEIKSFFDN